MHILDLILNVAILFIMMVPGVILKKCKLCSDTFGKGLSNLVLFIAQPCLIVYGYLCCTESFFDIWVGCLVTLALSFVSHTVFALVAIPVFKKAPGGARRILRFATVFSNSAYMAIPLIQALIDAPGSTVSPTAVVYATIYNITFNLFLWTLGVKICTDEEKASDEGGKRRLTPSWATVRRVLVHPVTIASAIGLVLLILGINLTDVTSAGLGIISDALLMLKNLVAPLSMVVIGLRLAELDMHGFFKDVYMYVFLALRHLALPLAIILLMLGLSLVIPVDSNVALVISIMAAAPAATAATMFAEKYDCDASYASRIVSISTILCIATMPLMASLAQRLL